MASANWPCLVAPFAEVVVMGALIPHEHVFDM
jgi:hypothetical protein